MNVAPLTQAQALTRLQSMLSWSDDPALSAAEVLDLLSMVRQADYYGSPPDDYQPWTPSGTYAVGATLVPRTRNGHFYTVTITDGAAGATEPTWPTTSGATVALDGVTYTESGLVSWLGAWALNRAAAKGWRWKAGKVASRYDFSSDVSGFKRDQLHKHCLEMAKLYDAGMVSIPIEAGVSEILDPVIGNLNGAA